MRLLQIIIGLAFGGLFAPVSAGPLNFAFQGEITSTQFVNADPFGGAMQVGTRYSGWYTFDPATLPLPGDACVLLSQCRWEFPVPPSSFDVEIGGLQIVVPNRYQIMQTNGDGSNVNEYDAYAVSSTCCFSFSGVEIAIEIVLGESGGRAFTDPSTLVLDPRPLLTWDRFQNSAFQIEDGSGTNWGRVEGRLTAFYLVGEPTSIALVIVGLAGLRMRRRKAA